METTKLKIAIVGAGNMGGAIARGLSRGTLVQNNNIFVSDVSESNLASLKAFNASIQTSVSNIEIVKNCQYCCAGCKALAGSVGCRRN